MNPGFTTGTSYIVLKVRGLMSDVWSLVAYFGSFFRASISLNYLKTWPKLVKDSDIWQADDGQSATRCLACGFGHLVRWCKLLWPWVRGRAYTGYTCLEWRPPPHNSHVRQPSYSSNLKIKSITSLSYSLEQGCPIEMSQMLLRTPWHKISFYLYSVRGLERSGLGGFMAAQGAFGTDFYDRCTRTIVGTMLWTEYRLVIKIGPKGALGSNEIRPIHSAPSLGQSIVNLSVPNHYWAIFRKVQKYNIIHFPRKIRSDKYKT